MSDIVIIARMGALEVEGYVTGEVISPCILITLARQSICNIVSQTNFADLWGCAIAFLQQKYVELMWYFECSREGRADQVSFQSPGAYTCR